MFTLIVGSALDKGLHFFALTPEHLKHLKHAKFCISKTSAAAWWLKRNTILWCRCLLISYPLMIFNMIKNSPKKRNSQ